MFVIINSVFAAGQITYIRLEERNHSSPDTIFWTMIFASILLSPIMIKFNFALLFPTNYVWVLLLGVISTGIAYLFSSKTIETIEVGKYALAGDISFPIISIAFEMLLFNETITTNTIVGGSLLMLSAAILHYEHRPINLNFSGFKVLMNRIKMINLTPRIPKS